MSSARAETPAGAAVYQLPEMVVEAPLPSAPADLPVVTGTGATYSAPTRHELGVPLLDAQREDKLYSSRRERLKSPYQKGSVIKSVVGVKPGFYAKTGLSAASVEVGLERDFGKLTYIDNAHTPYDSSDDSEKEVSPNSEGFFSSLKTSAGPWKSQIDFDYKQHDLFLGQLQLGNQIRREGAALVQYGTRRWDVTGFVFSSHASFRAFDPFGLSHESIGIQGGAYYKAQIAGGTVGIYSSVQNSERIYANAKTDFRRYWEKVELQTPYSLSKDWNLVTTAGLHATVDQTGTNQKFSPQWELGASVANDEKKVRGWEFKVSRYVNVPTLSQLFGDGALLEANPNLAAETGVLTSVKYWLGEKSNRIFFEPFFEYAVDRPLVVMTSPSAAKTQNLGAVRGLGLLSRWEIQKGNWEGFLSHRFQDSRNLSEINWQNGKPVPGRPVHLIKTGISYAPAPWKLEARYQWSSGETLDLAGLLELGSRQDLVLQAGLQEKTWAALLAFRQSFGKRGVYEAGIAGPQVFDQTVFTPQVEFMFEVAI